jgi:hypothetical protein
MPKAFVTNGKYFLHRRHIRTQGVQEDCRDRVHDACDNARDPVGDALENPIQYGDHPQKKRTAAQAVAP